MGLRNPGSQERKLMLEPLPSAPSYFRIMLWCLIACMLAGCFSTRGIREITVEPYPKIYEDDSTARFGDKDGNVFLEVRRAKLSRPLDNLAIHYGTFFPGGPPVKKGDRENYVKAAGRTAYKVVFNKKYIRHRKRLEKKLEPDEVPSGWTQITIEDPATGKAVPALSGPTVDRRRILHLVEGDRYLYYIFMRADGDSIEGAQKALDEFIQKGIDYK
jgi:hypothetical protein